MIQDIESGIWWPIYWPLDYVMERYTIKDKHVYGKLTILAKLMTTKLGDWHTDKDRADSFKDKPDSITIPRPQIMFRGTNSQKCIHDKKSELKDRIVQKSMRLIFRLIANVEFAVHLQTCVRNS